MLTRKLQQAIKEQSDDRFTLALKKAQRRCYPKYEKGVCDPNKFKDFYLQKYTNIKE